MNSHRSSILIGLISMSLAALPLSAQQTAPALAVIRRIPDNNATGVPTDTHLNITFNSPPVQGDAGQIRIYDAADNKLVDTLDMSFGTESYSVGGTNYNGYPILVSGNTAMIYPHNGALSYNKTYYVQMDPGVLKNDSGNFTGYSGTASWKFTTKTTPPAADAAKVIVAADGTGDFATVQGALDFVPANNTKPVTIFIRNGVYTELLNFSDKSNITLLGEDRYNTVVGYPNNPRLNGNRSVMHARNVMGTAMINFTIRDTTPKMSGGNQAETIIFDGLSTLLVSNCDFYSYQDTIQNNGWAYFTNSHIEGDIDFLWGTGVSYYDHCTMLELTSNDSVVVARNQDGAHGIILKDCKIDTAPGVKNAYLSQNQGYPSEVVLINCQLGPGFNPIGWRISTNRGAPGADTVPALNFHEWEFNSTNISDGKPIDASERGSWSRQLDATKDATTIANYSKPGWVFGDWTPTLAPIILNQPTVGLTMNSNNLNVSALSVKATGVPAPAYQWQLNGAPLKDGNGISEATTATLTINNANAGNYTVVVTNPSGSATSSAVALPAH